MLHVVYIFFAHILFFGHAVWFLLMLCVFDALSVSRIHIVVHCLFNVCTLLCTVCLIYAHCLMYAHCCALFVSCIHIVVRCLFNVYTL